MIEPVASQESFGRGFRELLPGHTYCFIWGQNVLCLASLDIFFHADPLLRTLSLLQMDIFFCSCFHIQLSWHLFQEVFPDNF